MMRLPLFALILVSLLFQGCATTQRLQASRADEVRRVVILAPAEPDEYEVRNDGSIAGMAIGNALTNSLDDRLTDAVVKRELRVSRYLPEKVALALARRGYVAEVVRERPGEQLLDDYGTYAQADAVLDMWVFHAGYGNVTMIDWKQRPALWMKVRLVRPDGTVLYADDVMYGVSNVFNGGVQLPAPKEHYYESYDAMFADEDLLLERFAAAMDAVAAELAGGLPER